MEEKVKKAIETYQCPGCMTGSDISCFKRDENYKGKGCSGHNAGTFMIGVGKLFLGMPKGFNRLGILGEVQEEKFKIYPVIYEKYEDYNHYDKFNIPVWKHLDEHGNTLVRGMLPRKNQPFLHIFLENCMDKINCLEITKTDIDKMD